MAPPLGGRSLEIPAVAPVATLQVAAAMWGRIAIAVAAEWGRIVIAVAVEWGQIVIAVVVERD